MNSNEVLKVLGVLQVAYPNFYKNVTKEQAQGVAKLWAEMFKDDPAELVNAAVMALIASDEKGFPPHIGAVKRQIRLLTAKDELTPQEVYLLVDKATKGDDFREEYNKLPEIVQKLVGSPGQLRTWAMGTADDFQNFVAPRIMQNYKILLDRKHEEDKIPENIRLDVKNILMLDKAES